MILMYHHVSPGCEVPRDQLAVEREGWRYTLEPDLFRRHLVRVKAAGFTFVPLSDYVDHGLDQSRRADRMCAVTFDDGWIDNYVHALPILEELKVPATFFIVSGQMPGVSAARRMSAEMLTSMADSGMEIGAHTRTHPNVALLRGAELEREVRGSRDDLEMAVGRQVRYFAYPGGRFSPEAVTAVREAGYEAACSVIPAGRNDGSWRFWLSRDVLSDNADTWRDRLLLSTTGRVMFRWARRCLRWRNGFTSGSSDHCLHTGVNS